MISDSFKWKGDRSRKPIRKSNHSARRVGVVVSQSDRRSFLIAMNLSTVRVSMIGSNSFESFDDSFPNYCRWVSFISITGMFWKSESLPYFARIIEGRLVNNRYTVKLNVMSRVVLMFNQCGICLKISFYSNLMFRKTSYHRSACFTNIHCTKRTRNIKTRFEAKRYNLSSGDSRR